jgi:ASPM-SPD-2-Hydin domain-containing protein/putative pyrroloquinoline-quinone-binding quinoprotein
MNPGGYLRVRSGTARRLVLAMTGLALTFAHADDVTASVDTERTGWDPGEPNMGPSVVPTFVQRFETTVAGQVFAQPLVIDSLNQVIVVTENDWAYGLNATTGAVDWQQHLGSAFVIGKASSTKLRKCGDLVPNVGVTGTPVYDPGTGMVYFFAKIMSGSTPNYYLIELNPTNPAAFKKILISGHPGNDSHITFSGMFNHERAGALLMGGGVYGAFASHCDTKPYTGYVTRVDLASGKVSLWADEAQTVDDQGGIWMSGAGVMADPQGHVFVTTGNGVSPPKTGTPPGQLAESVVRLAYHASTNKLLAKDFFSPANAPSLDAADTDFGSAGPAALPFGTSSGSAQQMLVAPSKDGRIWLLDRNNLGGREQGPGSTDNALFWTKAYGGTWGHPAVFGDTPILSDTTNDTANDFVFNVGRNDSLRVFRVEVTASGAPVLSDVANSTLTYDYAAGSPVVTSNGADPNSAVIWEVHMAANTGVNAELDAYALGDIVNGSSPSTCTSANQCSMSPIWSAPIGDATRFSIPATDNGWVYVGTRDTGATAGHVFGFSVPATASSVQAATTTVPAAHVSSTASSVVTITARKPVTFRSVTASTGATNALVQQDQYSVGQATVTPAGSTAAHPVTFPVTLRKSDKLNVKVTFAPAAPGGADGFLTFTTSNGHTRVVPLTGDAIQTGLQATPASAVFPLSADQGVTDVPVGISVTQNVDIINGGATTETVSSVTPPAGGFSAAGMPIRGQKITPGESFIVQFTFAPTHPGPASGSFAISTTSGNRVKVALSGVGAPSVSHVNADHRVTDFGSVKVGTTATQYIHITNNGNIPSEVRVPSPPKAPFHSKFKVLPGLPLNPGYDLLIPVTFTPAAAGTFTAPYTLVWKDRLGTHSLTVTLTGTAV